MGNFRKNNKSGGKENRGGFVSRDSRKPAMHKVICSECGKDCEVPFKPTGDKPVFCSDCFSRKRNAEPRRFGGKDSGRFNSGDRRMHKAICDNCGKECEVPFKPTSSKPIYCSQCFSEGGRDKSSNQTSQTSQTSKQFETIDAKLDRILKMLNPSISVKEDKKKKVVKKTKTIKPKKTSKNKEKKAVSSKKTKAKKKK